MPRIRLPTPEITEQIRTFICAGGFPHVAAEAVGIPRERFEAWFEEGRHAKVGTRLQKFFSIVLQAHAQARLRAEIEALKEKPMDWLKCGPGKETHDNPGWTTPAREKAAASGAERKSALELPEFQDFLAALFKALEPHDAAYEDITKALVGVVPIPKRSN